MANTEKAAWQTGARARILVESILVLSPLAYILIVQSRLRRASRPGRAVSASIASTAKQLTTVSRAGALGDPINIQFVGTDRQIGASFAAAGWYRADEIDFVTSVRISVDSILDRKYSTAPVSNLYLYGRKEDLAFERPGLNVRQRDHIRIWDSSGKGSDGRPIWIGSVTKDTKIEIAKTNHLPTHHISPDVDAERALIVAELSATGYVAQTSTRPGFGKPTQALNGEGDPYTTDGMVAVLTIANITTTPLATQVRSPLVAQLAKRLNGLLDHWLPRTRREHAAREDRANS